MNQDFAMLATPANVRRLLLFQRVCKIELTAKLTALAQQDRIDESAFDPMACPYDLAKLTVTQFLLDCGMRGVVQTAYHPEIHPIALLNAVRLTKPEQVVIATGRHRLWMSASRALNLPVKLISDPSHYSLEGNLEPIDRRAVVIFDLNQLANPAIRHLVREFPRTIIYEYREIDQMLPWPIWARMLFPGMPHPMFPRVIKDVPAEWSKQSLSAFALFYNVCIFPHLITTPSIVAALEDDYLIERIKYNSSLLTM